MIIVQYCTYIKGKSDIKKLNCKDEIATRTSSVKTARCCIVIKKPLADDENHVAAFVHVDFHQGTYFTNLIGLQWSSIACLLQSAHYTAVWNTNSQSTTTVPSSAFVNQPQTIFWSHFIIHMLTYCLVFVRTVANHWNFASFQAISNHIARE